MSTTSGTEWSPALFKHDLEQVAEFCRVGENPRMLNEYAVVDLFAGPGGLAEGFASVRTEDGSRPFRTKLSVEKETSAHATLLLRSFLRQFDDFPPEYYRFLNEGIPEPDWNALYPQEWTAATMEALQLELGSESAAETLHPILDDIRAKYQDNIVVIGGPPCQAYSVAGRARNKGIKGYVPAEDKRHYLYQEYIGILQRLRPAAFVMENVKGLLSSSVSGHKVFDLVLDDLSALAARGEGYRREALTPRSGWMLGSSGIHPPITDYIVCAEDLGVPQARHRVIVVGIRSDIASQLDWQELEAGLLRNSGARATVRDVLGGMPQLRSGLSRAEDNETAWRAEVQNAISTVSNLLSMPGNGAPEELRARANTYRESFARNERRLARSGMRPVGIGPDCPESLRTWILDPNLEALPNNETRSHMPSDFARYFFTALFGEVTGVSPKSRDFPPMLAPDHRSWARGDFADRFRVQLWNQPSTTVTSHIAKDGHFFIHPDPAQCRSLTVREAARLQTFPDNYYFKGNRTQQYIQVGNAVPPFLARQIAESLYALLADRGMKCDYREP